MIHLDVATSLWSLGALYESRAKYTEAELLLERALAVYASPRGNLPPNNPFQADLLEHLAKIYRAQAKVREAEEAETRAALLRTMR